jgi:hypothetical protein
MSSKLTIRRTTGREAPLAIAAKSSGAIKTIINAFRNIVNFSYSVERTFNGFSGIETKSPCQEWAGASRSNPLYASRSRLKGEIKSLIKPLTEITAMTISSSGKGRPRIAGNRIPIALAIAMALSAQTVLYVQVSVRVRRFMATPFYSLLLSVL